MKPKTLLITTVLGIATTAAFGAASLRAPQMGGTATVTTPTATNTARAGTMRTQTMKTSSVSAPSVTTTQSIATPVSTETTDARLSLLKGIKGFNPGKIKDTTAAQQELNAIDSRIEELQSKLDQAETAADQTAKLTDVYTKEQVEAKINEKISAIGTSTGTKDTYSKTEINKLLPYKENGLVYLPVLPGQPGSGDIGTATPTVIAPEWRFRNMGFETYDNNMVTIHKFVTLAPNNEITNFVNEFCHDIESGNSYWCGKYGDTLPYNNDTGERMFKIRHRHRGHAYHTQTRPDYFWYYTNEPNPETYMNGQINSTLDEITQIETQSDPHAKYHIEIGPKPRYWEWYGPEENPYNPLAHLGYFYAGNPSDETFRSWEAEVCQQYTNELGCCMTSHNSGVFWVNVLHNGYKLWGTSYITIVDGKRTITDVVASFEYANDLESLREAVCKGAPITDCWLRDDPSFSTYCNQSMVIVNVLWSLDMPQPVPGEENTEE